MDFRPKRLAELLQNKKGGRWKINDRHEVQYWSEDGQNTAAIKAAVLDVRPAALVLQYTQKENDRIVTRVFELTGVWRVDAKNRIVFIVEKKGGSPDVLTFRNVWTVNANHEVEYSFEETALKKGKRTSRKLVFSGFWDISEKSRITYWLGKDSESYFRFRGAFQTASILAKKEEIRYQVGVEVEKGVRTRTIVLFGKWKYSRAYGLSFEVEYKDGRKRVIRFGADYSPTARDRVELSLVNAQGKPLGIELLVTKDFLKKDGQAFVRLFKDAGETRIEAGAAGRW